MLERCFWRICPILYSTKRESETELLLYQMTMATSSHELMVKVAKIFLMFMVTVTYDIPSIMMSFGSSIGSISLNGM